MIRCKNQISLPLNRLTTTGGVFDLYSFCFDYRIFCLAVQPNFEVAKGSSFYDQEYENTLTINYLVMKTIIFFLAAASLVLKSFSALEPSESSERHFSSRGTPVNPSLPYRYDSVKLVSKFQYDHPVSANKQAYARIVYPVFPDNNLNGIITDAVLSPLKVKYQFKNSLTAEYPALSNMDAVNNGAGEYRELAANFLRQFETEAPGDYSKAYWYADIQVKILCESQDFTAVVCEKDYFTGGLHDLYDHQFLNYDNHNHQLITLESQLKPNKKAQLKSIAERIFRKNEHLSAKDELDGYFFENAKFGLPASFTITDNGLMFFYEYYEIKPFAAGTTKLVIPFTELKELVLPGSIMAGQMKLH